MGHRGGWGFRLGGLGVWSTYGFDSDKILGSGLWFRC